MMDGEGDPTEELRSALNAARGIAANSQNNVLAYLIEAALAELDEHGLEPAPRDNLPTSGLV